MKFLYIFGAFFLVFNMEAEIKTFEYQNVKFGSHQQLIKYYEGLSTKEIINFQIAFVDYFKSNYQEKKHVTEAEAQNLGKLIDFKTLAEIDRKYLSSIRKGLRKKNKAPYFKFKRQLEATVFFTNILFTLDDLISRKKIVEEDKGNLLKLHKFLYTKPPSKERLLEIKQYWDRQIKEKERIDKLIAEGIDPVADEILKNLGKGKPAGVEYEYIRDYAKSLNKALNDKNEKQLNYLTQEKFLDGIFPYYKKYDKFIEEAYSRNPDNLKEAKETFKVIDDVCTPLVQKLAKARKAKFKALKKQQEEETKNIMAKLGIKEPELLKDKSKITEIEKTLKNSLEVLSRNKVNEIYQILSLDSNSKYRKTGYKNYFFNTYPRYDREYDLRIKLMALIQSLLKEDKSNWLEMKKDFFLVLPKKLWLERDKSRKPYISTMDALQLVWFPEEKVYRLYITRHDLPRLRDLKFFK